MWAEETQELGVCYLAFSPVPSGPANMGHEALSALDRLAYSL